MKYATIVEPIISEDVNYNFSVQIEVKKVDFVVNTVCSIMHESWKAEKKVMQIATGLWKCQRLNFSPDFPLLNI